MKLERYLLWASIGLLTAACSLNTVSLRQIDNHLDRAVEILCKVALRTGRDHVKLSELSIGGGSHIDHGARERAEQKGVVR